MKNLKLIDVGKCVECPLCQTSNGTPFHRDRREYLQCQNCQMVFVLPDYFLSSEEEKSVYEQHQNNPDDQRYRQFLGRLFNPLEEQLTPNSCGLDFGSGPGPTLSVMLEETGHSMTLYDPFYAPDTSAFDQNYDFITATEVVEHLHHPRQQLEKLWACLKANGILAIMTKRLSEKASFSHWHYKDDPTHVCFYSIKSFEWLANQWLAKLTIPGNDTVFLTKT